MSDKQEPLDDAAFLRDLAGRLFRLATPAQGFDQGDTDRLYRIARLASTSAGAERAFASVSPLSVAIPILPFESSP